MVSVRKITQRSSPGRLHLIATRRHLAATGEMEVSFDNDKSISPSPVNVLGRFNNTVYVAVDSWCPALLVPFS